MSVWDRYSRWNAAICETVFTEQLAGRPVYLDMDDSVIAEVSARLSVAADEAQGELVQAVRATLDLGGNQGDVFRAHLARQHQWRRTVARRSSAGSEVAPPPTMALLAVFTLAAEAMGVDKTVAVHAYYPRLAAVLGATGDSSKARIQGAYQASAEQLWRGLNDWLTLADGRYGVPTAQALTHRYIGLPLSQALIRAADRRHLTRMFRQFGLPPGSDIPPADMARILDSWIQQAPCPASKNLQALWQRAGAQERIAEVAATELASCEDTLTDEPGERGASRSGSIRLTAYVRRFPKPGFQLSFLAAIPVAAVPDALVVRSASGEPVLEMLPAAGGLVQPRSTAGIDPRSLVEGVLHLAEPASGIDARRYPRRVVPLRRDDQLNAFIECERVQLGEDFMILVKDGPQAEQTGQLLTVIARPGFGMITSLPGLPKGWTLFTDVQVLAAPVADPAHTDLNCLVPIVSSQLGIAGGLKIPGNLRKWSSLQPPEIRAVSQLATDLELSMTRLQLDSGETAEPRVWQTKRGVLLVDLADEGLEDGDYELKVEGDGRALQRSILRLRSSDTPDRWTWETAARVSYAASSPLSAHRADVVTPGDVTGALVAHPADQTDSSSRDIGRVWWSAERPPKPVSVPIIIAAPDRTSCVVTGAHRIQLPRTPTGRPTSPMFSGECTQCGVVKRYPAWPRRAWKGGAKQASLELDQTGRLQHLTEASALTIDHDVALDALVHVGGGRASSLERIVAQVDSSALAADSFRRNLELLSHVDVSRNERLEVSTWSVSPPCLAEASDGTFILTGAWAEAAWLRLRDVVEDAGGSFTSGENTHGPTAWFVEGLDATCLEGLLTHVKGLLPMEQLPTVVTDAAMNLVRVLPRLSTVEQALPRVPLPGARRIERFNVAAASWEQVHTASSAGAFRIESAFRSMYVYRSEGDVERQQVAVGTAQLVKHLEALRMGRPLLGYYPGARRLATALGADLPGLYGRAAVLNSGLLPTGASKQRALVYHDVPEAFATCLFDLLAN